VEIDSTSKRIILSYVVERIPEGITYYEFPYPIFFQIAAHSSIDVYSQVQCFTKLKHVADGDWGCMVRVGYLSAESDFRGFVDHGLRDQLVAKQHWITSPEVQLTKVSR
jgi:hypothetical protein